jgi:hypothetical protein
MAENGKEAKPSEHCDKGLAEWFVPVSVLGVRSFHALICVVASQKWGKEEEWPAPGSGQVAVPMRNIF